MPCVGVGLAIGGVFAQGLVGRKIGGQDVDRAVAVNGAAIAIGGIAYERHPGRVNGGVVVAQNGATPARCKAIGDIQGDEI